MRQLSTWRSTVEAIEGSAVASGAGLHARTHAAVAVARDHLLSLQHEDGHWCGELEGDSVLESEYSLLLHFLGRGDSDHVRKAAAVVRRRQLPDAGWAIYPGGPSDVSASIKAYFVLKLAGDDPSAPHMEAARRTVLELGGLEAANTYTKIYLAIFGQYDWEGCPAVPPEMILLPRWFYFNVNEMSSWSRGIFVPLSVIWAHRPHFAVPRSASVAELRTSSEPARQARSAMEGLWQSFFYRADRGLKVLEKSRFKPLRRRALEVAEQWTLERLDMSDGLGAIFPAIINTIMAFRCLGYAPEHPAIVSQLDALDKLIIDEDDYFKVQPALSPVWDTAQSVNALLTAGVDSRDPAIQRAAAWLVDREVRHPGDWVHKNPDGPVGGWYFEYANEFYPDCDDTADVVTALARLDGIAPELGERVAAARGRAVRWLLSMQNEDGGWAAFDKGCDKEILTFVPFADHNAMIDPSCEDITGRVLETFACEGIPATHPAVRRAIEFLNRTQRADGTWYGRWGCNYIYGTWLALWGLYSIGVDMGQERYQRAARWLLRHQNDDGGWGESLRSYEDPSTKGVGPSTAAQTSWALIGLYAAGHQHSAAARRGIEYLLETQRADGSWDDPWWTGTGFPQVFYLRYHLYDDYFPLLALATYDDEFDRDRTARSIMAAVPSNDEH